MAEWGVQKMTLMVVTHLREVCTCVNLIGITDVDKSEAYGWTQSVMDSLHTLLFCY